MPTLILMVLLGVATSSRSLAQLKPEVPNFQIHQPYISPRVMGMGGAFAALADDPSALFYNPAGLARLEEGNLNLFIGAGLDGEVSKFVDEINTAMEKEDATTQLAELIEANYGKHFWARATPLGAMYARPKWGIALIPADLSVSLSVHQQIGPTLNVISVADSTLAIGFAKKIQSENHQLSIGMTLKPIYRAYYAQSVPAPQLATEQEIIRPELAQEGATVDVDLGLLWTPPVAEEGFFKFFQYAEPTFALVVRNAADYGFPVKTTLVNEMEQSPVKLQRRIDVGTRFELPRMWVFYPRFLFDERDILHRNFTLLKGSHAGFELNWKVRSWLHGGYRFGYSQGYLTAGVSAAFAVFMLEAATWGEEVGTSEAKKENRRYLMRASLDF